MLALNAFGQINVLIIGDVMLDHYVESDVSRVSDEAPVPILHVKKERFVAGGAANVAMNCAALGARVSLISVVGCDDASRELTNCLSSNDRINFNFLADPNRSTTLKTRYLGRNQQVVRVDREDTSAICSELTDRLLEEFQLALPSASILIISDYAKGVLTDKVLQQVIQAARVAGKHVIVDPKRKDLSIYAGASVITPNRKELSAATGLLCEEDSDCVRAAKSVIESTGSAVLVTRSERGMSYISAGVDPIHMQSAAQQVFDVSGAGDTVIAAFSLALALGIEIRDAVSFANVSAGLSVAKSGTAAISMAEVLGSFHWSSTGQNGAIFRDLSAAEFVVSDWKSKGLRVGFTNGCFDLIHPGHVKIIQKSAQLCDKLVVALNSDLSVKKIKGDARPVQDEQSRASVVSAINGVALVVVFDEEDPLRVINALKPDVLVKGSDYQIAQIIGANEVVSWGGQVHTVELEIGHSTTKIVDKLKQL